MKTSAAEKKLDQLMHARGYLRYEGLWWTNSPNAVYIAEEAEGMKSGLYFRYLSKTKSYAISAFKCHVPTKRLAIPVLEYFAQAGSNAKYAEGNGLLLPFLYSIPLHEFTKPIFGESIPANVKTFELDLERLFSEVINSHFAPTRTEADFLDFVLLSNGPFRWGAGDTYPKCVMAIILLLRQGVESREIEEKFETIESNLYADGHLYRYQGSLLHDIVQYCYGTTLSL